MSFEKATSYLSREEIMIVNLSGRGDKDVYATAAYINLQ
jgi:tryptophan synthase beta subunit